VVSITWTHEAERWLREIHDYIARDNPPAAKRTVQGIQRKARLLAKSPRLGYRHEPIQDREVRIILYGRYRIAYLIKSDKEIDIVGIFHAALDIERYLG
jgi:plasmid stabilization system protein ParE